MIYVDTSALVPYYCPEDLSAKVQRHLDRRADRAVSDLVEVELCSAIARKVRANELAPGDGQRILSAFLAHLEAGVYIRLPVERRHYTLARNWLAALKPPLAALDALHVAVAAAEGCPLITLDAALARAARALGVAARVLRQNRGPAEPAPGRRRLRP